MGTVAGLFDTWSDARPALEALRQNGFPDHDLSIVGRNASVQPREDVEILAAGAELVAGLEVVTVPDIGASLAGGPLSAALCGGLLDALVDQGIPVAEARDYQVGVDRGDILLTVEAPAAREAEARVLLRQHRSKPANPAPIGLGLEVDRRQLPQG